MQPERLGPYRITRTLGRGGMGMVYEGINVETDEPAAIKILSVTLAQEPDFRHRFEGEIETLRMLRHPNIVRLFGFGEQDGLLYYAMELVDGPSLEQELRNGRRFNWREVAQITIEVCRALRHAHDRGVIHRDIKPANLLLGSNGQVKLSDFGIARLFGDTRLTAAGNVLGTVEFMAPEQADAKPVGPRSDLYSLGGVMYALLTGRAPFKAKSLAEMLDKQRHATPEPVRCYEPEVPAELESIVAQLLEKDPASRIPNATLLARRLEAMLHALSRTAEPATRLTIGEGEQGFDLMKPTVDAPIEDAALPPTRLATPTAVQPQTEAHHSAVHDLPPTKETSAFQAYAAAQGADASTDASGPTKPSNRFVTIEDEQLDQIDDESPGKALISPQTWVLVAALVMTGLTAWYLLRPPSADSLYDRIITETREHTVASYLRAEDDIREFLMRYSDDPRAEMMREYLKEIELNDLERKFELRARGLVAAETLLPIERDYLEALNYARLSPELGIAKLQALVDLYQRPDSSGPTGQCLKLARRRIAQLQEEIERSSADHLALVMGQLDKADQFEATDPDRASRMRKAVIELYDDKPWAAPAVRRAREALKTSGGLRDRTESPAVR